MSEDIRILLIDDEQVVHDSIRRILSRFGYEVVSTLDPTDGLEKLEISKRNLIILLIIIVGGFFATIGLDSLIYFLTTIL